MEVAAFEINNMPALRSYTQIFTTADISKTFRFFLTAYNSLGTVKSKFLPLNLRLYLKTNFNSHSQLKIYICAGNTGGLRSFDRVSK